eukprot:SAG31_NODE_47_length_30979_cov_41.708841_12_plen_156_part_00
MFDSQRFVTSPLVRQPCTSLPCIEITFSTSGELDDVLRAQVEEYGKSNVHVFFCIDSPNGPKLNGRQFGGLELAKVFQYSKSAGGQFGRFAKCFGDVRKWTRQVSTSHTISYYLISYYLILSQAGSWGRYSWFVRTRPDMIFYGAASRHMNEKSS